jgi:hypothetical protein
MYQALFATSETIRKFIELGIKNLSGVSVSYQALLNTPEELRANSKEGVSIWLYRINRDPDRLNDPPERVGWDRMRPAPLPLRLHYLMTPVTNNTSTQLGSAADEQLLLGRILQLFHVHSVLRGTDLQADFAGTSVELRLRLEPMSLEEITRVWEALEGSYQLSVSYEVSLVNIESDQEPELAEPVTVAMPEYGIIVSGP